MLKFIFVGLIPVIISRVELMRIPHSLKILIESLLKILSQLLEYSPTRADEFWRKQRYNIAKAALDFLREYLNERTPGTSAENDSIAVQLMSLTQNPNIQ